MTRFWRLSLYNDDEDMLPAFGYTTSPCHSHLVIPMALVFRSFSSLFPHHPWVPAGKNRAVPLEAYPRYHLARSRPFSDHAEESMREHSKQKTHIWFLIEGLLQNLTDSPGSFTCSFCGLALHELVPTGRCLAARGLKSGMQTQEQLLRVSFPHGRKPLIFFWTKHGRFANKQFPENWAGPHLLVKATPQSCQSLFYPSPLRFGSRALHSVSEPDSTMGAKGNQNGS